MHIVTLFNRKEIKITRDLYYCNTICNALANRKIEYYIRTNSITNPGRSHGVPFISSDFAFEYRIYVKKRDFELALEIIK